VVAETAEVAAVLLALGAAAAAGGGGTKGGSGTAIGVKSLKQSAVC